VVNDDAVVVTGFYEFTRMTEGKPLPAPARFTELLNQDRRPMLIAPSTLLSRATPTRT
jgi:hypothetical protein